MSFIDTNTFDLRPTGQDTIIQDWLLQM